MSKDPKDYCNDIGFSFNASYYCDVHTMKYIENQILNELPRKSFEDKLLAVWNLNEQWEDLGEIMEVGESITDMRKDDFLTKLHIDTIVDLRLDKDGVEYFVEDMDGNPIHIVDTRYLEDDPNDEYVCSDCLHQFIQKRDSNTL